MATAEQVMGVIQKSVATAVVAMKQFRLLLDVGAGAEDGGRSGGEGRMMREVVGTVGKRTKKFGGSGVQDSKFRMELAVKGSCGKLQVHGVGGGPRLVHRPCDERH